MYDHWKIERLRGVGDVELNFDPDSKLRVLFGPNGVGKTKCLEAIFQTLLLLNKDFWRHAGQVGINEDNIFIKRVLLDGEVFYSFEKLPHNALALSYVFRESESFKRHQVPVVYLGAQHRSDISGASVTAKLVGNFDERRNGIFDAYGKAIANLKFKSLGMNESVHEWFVSRAQSVNPYQKSADNRKNEIDAVLKMLHAVDGRINVSFLELDGRGEVFLSVGGDRRSLSQLSSGFASLVKLMQAIVSGYARFINSGDLLNYAGFVFIDEIESHLHPEWQTKICKTLTAAMPNTVFYVATHSPLVLSQLKEGEAHLLRRYEDGVVRNERVRAPNKRALVDVLESGFGIDINALKRDSLMTEDQSSAKEALARLLGGGKESL